jgi:hypothetical protein
MNKNNTVSESTLSQNDIKMEYIRKFYKKEYPNMPNHKYNRIMREYEKMNKSDWLDGEIFIPQNLPKEFWDFERF